MRAQSGNHYSRNIVVLVTLDVKNAFNSVRWTDVLKSLEHRFHVPGYLVRIIGDYLSERVLLYDTTDCTKTRPSAGAAQSSNLGPDLWNVMYDGILELKISTDAMSFAYLVT